VITYHCDICNNQIHTPQEGYYLILKSAAVLENNNPFILPVADPHEVRNLICANCCAMVGKAILQRTPETRIQVVMSKGTNATLLSEKEVLMTPSLSIILDATMVQKKVIEFFAEEAKKYAQKEKGPSTTVPGNIKI